MYESRKLGLRTKEVTTRCQLGWYVVRLGVATVCRPGVTGRCSSSIFPFFLFARGEKTDTKIENLLSTFSTLLFLPCPIMKVILISVHNQRM